MEVWKDILGYEGLYQVSSNGNIRSCRRYRKGKGGSPTLCKERLLKVQINKFGYVQVCLCKENKKKLLSVHRLVAMAFMENPHNLPCVDHIDGVRVNNKLSNLRWCTTKENMNFDIVRERISNVQKTNPKCKQHQTDIQKKVRKPIVAIFPDGRVKEYESAAQAEREGGFYHSHVTACCRGRLSIYKGCKFFYKSEYYGNKS